MNNCKGNCDWTLHCFSCFCKKIENHPLSIPYGLRNYITFDIYGSIETYLSVKYLFKTSDWFSIQNYTNSICSLIFNNFDLNKESQKTIKEYIQGILYETKISFLSLNDKKILINYNDKEDFVDNKICKELMIQFMEEKEFNKMIYILKDCWIKIGSNNTLKIIKKKYEEKEEEMIYVLCFQLFLLHFTQNIYPDNNTKNIIYIKDILFGSFNSRK
jgi:hypothetical protein